MTFGTPCYCINPRCGDRRNHYSFKQKECQRCGTPLVIAPHNLLLKEPIYGFQEKTNSEIFTVENLGGDSMPYPQVLKILQHPEAIAVNLFRQEGSLLQQLRGLAVPQVGHQPYFTVTIEQGRSPAMQLHCLLMEKILGKSLGQYINPSHKIDQDIALDWLRQLAQLLVTTHRRNIIHRDIKPDNIMVRPSENHPHGELVLIDFGTARTITTTYLEKVARNEPMASIFSLGYAAPEQQQGKYSFRSDLYAVGKTILAAISGLDGNDPAFPDVDWRSQISIKPLCTLLQRLTKPELTQRPPSAAVLLAEVEKILQVEHLPPLLGWFSLHRQQVIQRGAIAGLIAISLGLASTPLRQAYASYLFTQGKNAFQNENPEKAIQKYRASLFWNASNAETNLALAYACEEIKDIICAEKYYDQTINLSHNNSPSIYVSAVNNRMLIDIKRHQNIDQAIQELLVILPQSYEVKDQGYVHKNLAWGYLLKQDIEQASWHLSQATSELKNNEDVQCLSSVLSQSEAIVESETIAQCSDLKGYIATDVSQR